MSDKNVLPARWEPRGFIGVVHLPAMPGDPGYVRGGFEGVMRFALRDAEALASGGVDAMIVENFGSAPFPKGDASARTAPHQVAALARIAGRCKEQFGLPVGVNCLRNDVMSALGIAAAADLDFVRVNVHVGAYVTDQGIIEGEAHDSLRYRAALDSDHVAILADVLVKHAAPLATTDPVTLTKDTVQRGKADAVIVTGSATGSAVDVARLEAVSGAARPAPVLIGSGMTPELTAQLGRFADGAIVGSWLKRDGVVHHPVDRGRVEAMRAALREGLRRATGVS